MREPRGKGADNAGGVAGNDDQPQVESTKSRPLISADKGPIIAAVITATASLLIYSLQQIRHIDERLDVLEQKAKVILDHEGQVRPSREAMEAYFKVIAFDRRLERLEQRQDDVD